MKVMQAERERQHRSRAEVARAAGLTGSNYSWMETGRFQPYPVQLARIVDALEWDQDSGDLLKEVDDADH